MNTTAEERRALLDAVDFITTNADGADEANYPNDILAGLHSLYKKAQAQQHKQRVAYYLKKLKRNNKNKTV